MRHFWEGFEKQAIRLGAKGVQPLSAAGKMVGNRPMSGVSTAAAFKPAPLPTPAQMSPVKNTAATLGGARPAKVMAQPSQRGPGVDGVVA